jgi:hypothetical protein
MYEVWLSLFLFIGASCLFYLLTLLFQYSRLSISEFPRQGRTKIFFLIVQIICLAIAVNIFIDDPYVLPNQDSMHYDLRMNMVIHFFVILSVVSYLLSAFGFQDESPDSMKAATRKRVLLSIGILLLLFVLFNTLMQHDESFHHALTAINPSDAAGGVMFTIAFLLFVLYAASGFKPNEEHQKTTAILSTIMGIVHIAVVYCIYIQQNPDRWEYYFDKLGGHG